ncbi:MAG: S-layer homology domain-containing protein [Oscillospiraceae bacterium]|nr:S-layer homology domain-containing protein [Oscillospiraceae bacterium]
MKTISKKLLTLVLAVVMITALAVPALAADSLSYDGDSVDFIKADGSQFGMFTPQEGTTAVLDGDNVVIHYVPKNTTVYNALHFGPISDTELTKDVSFNEDGSFDITLSKDKCGTAIPVAPIKAKDGKTTSDQYYLAIPAADKLKADTPVLISPAPYSGESVNFIKADGSQFGMFTPQEGTTAVLDGDNIVIHFVPKNTTVYNALHFGPISDAELTKDVVFNEDGTFDITLGKDKCGTSIPVAPIKAKDGATTSDQYFLAIPAADKLQAAAPKGDALTITNTTSMFKGDSASLEKTDSGSVLVVALSGTTYKYLFKGTYEQAVANGDQRASWIEGKTNSDGKIEFRIPVADGEAVIPAVSISNTYLTKYESGENSLARAFYPRQFVLDAEAKTLTIGDYEDSRDLTVTNNVKMFRVSAAKLVTVGGPNSNNYKADLALTMGSDSYNAAYVGRSSAIKEDTAVIELGEGNLFELPTKWLGTFGKPETLQSILEKPFIVSFRSAKNGTWYERQFTIDENAGTLVIDEAPAAPSFSDVAETSPYYEAVEWAVKQAVTNGVSETRFEPDQNCTRAQIVTFIWRAQGCQEPTISNPFTDINESDYFFKAALWAVEKGLIVSGDAAVFEPKAECTRLEAVTYLWIAAGSPAAQGSGTFTDVTSGADAVNWAVEQGITDGMTATTFAPDRTCTRGQIVTFLYRCTKA